MSGPGCGLPREWLVALRDGDLHAAQLELAEEHLRGCPQCRRWMAEMDEIDRLLRDATPYRDNPLARAEVKRRVATAPERVRPFGSTSPGKGIQRLLAGGLVVLAVLALTALPWRDPLTEASSGLAGWIRDEPLTLPSANAPGTPVVAPTNVSSPVELPLGLAQAGETETGASFTQRYYRSASGLAISYSADCSGTNFLSKPSRANLVETVGVNGEPVRVDYGLQRRSLTALSWETADTLHLVLILEDTTPPITLDDALLLVAELMSREDAYTALVCDG